MTIISPRDITFCYLYTLKARTLIKFRPSCSDLAYQSVHMNDFVVCVKIHKSLKFQNCPNSLKLLSWLTEQTYWFLQSLSLLLFLLLSFNSLILCLSIWHGSQEGVDGSKEVLWFVLWGVLPKEFAHQVKLLINRVECIDFLCFTVQD